MQKLDFNFVSHPTWYSSWKKSPLDFLLVVAAILILLILFMLYQFKLSTLNDLQAQKAAKPIITPKPIAPQQIAYFQHFKEVQEGLNVPWMETFNSLEMVKKAHPNIQLMAVDPNMKRREMTIKLKAETFDEVTDFIVSLRKSPHFSEVELVSQHVESTDDGEMSFFDLHMGWKL